VGDVQVIGLGHHRFVVAAGDHQRGVLHEKVGDFVAYKQGLISESKVFHAVTVGKSDGVRQPP